MPVLYPAFSSVSVITAAPAADAPFIEIFPRFGVLAFQGMGITEIGIQLQGAAPATVGLIRTLVAGTSDPTGDHPGLLETNTGASASLIATKWTVAPTVAAPAEYFRKETLLVTGDRILWKWDPEAPFVIPRGTTAALWAPAGFAGSILKVYVKWADDQIVSNVKQVYLVNP